jgi:hypothetical protein
MQCADAAVGDVLQYADGTLYIVTKVSATEGCLYGWQPGLGLHWRVLLPFADLARVRHTGRNAARDMRAQDVSGSAAEASYLASLVRALHGRLAP